MTTTHEETRPADGAEEYDDFQPEVILAIETSTSRGSVALVEEGDVRDMREFSSDRAHNSVIFEPLAAVLKDAPPLSLVVVGTGPGSYGGVRVGIAAALGVSLAQGVPLIGVPSICALVHGAGQERYAVAGDARRGAWWYAEVVNGRLAAPPAVGDEAEISLLTGRWVARLLTIDADGPPFCQAVSSFPRADLLASRARALYPEEVERLAAVETEPLYLRAPFITKSKKPVFT